MAGHSQSYMGKRAFWTSHHSSHHPRCLLSLFIEEEIVTERKSLCVFVNYLSFWNSSSICWMR
jgi:hypothetical protein